MSSWEYWMTGHGHRAQSQSLGARQGSSLPTYIYISHHFSHDKLWQLTETLPPAADDHKQTHTESVQNCNTCHLCNFIKSSSCMCLLNTLANINMLPAATVQISQPSFFTVLKSLYLEQRAKSVNFAFDLACFCFLSSLATGLEKCPLRRRFRVMDYFDSCQTGILQLG